MAQTATGNASEEAASNALLLQHTSDTIPTPFPLQSIEELRPQTMADAESSSRTRAVTGPANQRPHQRQSQILHLRPQSLDLKPQDFSDTSYNLHSRYVPTGDWKTNLEQTPRYSPDCMAQFKDPEKLNSAESSGSGSYSSTPSSSESIQQQNAPSSDDSPQPVEENSVHNAISPGELTPETGVESNSSLLANESSEKSGLEYKNHLEISREALINDRDDQESEDEEGDEEDECVEEYRTSNVGDLEAEVLRITGHNFELAAQIIPQLLLLLYEERSHVIGSWKYIPKQCAAGQSDQAAGTSANQSQLGVSSGESSRKRKARHRGSKDGSGGEEGDGEEGNGDDNQKGGNGRGSSIPRFACPFGKRYPLEYDPSHKIKPCSDRGYVDLKHLIDHLKRNHRHVQCDRCPERFTGSPKDRRLAFWTHREGQNCQSSPIDKKEGVTELQLVRIEGSPKATAGRPKSGVERWEEIWRIIFPDLVNEKPPDPWYRPPTYGILSVSALEDQTATYAMCYDSTLAGWRTQRRPMQEDNSNDYVEFDPPSSKDISMRAFRLWYTKCCTERGTAELTFEHPSTSHHQSTAATSDVTEDDFFQCVTRPAAAMRTVPLSTLRSVSSPQPTTNNYGSSNGSAMLTQYPDQGRERSVSAPVARMEDLIIEDLDLPLPSPSYAPPNLGQPGSCNFPLQAQSTELLVDGAGYQMSGIPSTEGSSEFRKFGKGLYVSNQAMSTPYGQGPQPQYQHQPLEDIYLSIPNAMYDVNAQYQPNLSQQTPYLASPSYVRTPAPDANGLLLQAQNTQSQTFPHRQNIESQGSGVSSNGPQSSANSYGLG